MGFRLQAVVSKELFQAVEERAAADGRSMSSWLGRLLERELARLIEREQPTPVADIVAGGMAAGRGGTSHTRSPRTSRPSPSTPSLP